MFAKVKQCSVHFSSRESKTIFKERSTSTRLNLEHVITITEEVLYKKDIKKDKDIKYYSLQVLDIGYIYITKSCGDELIKLLPTP